MHAHALRAAESVRARATGMTTLMTLRVGPLSLRQPFIVPSSLKCPFTCMRASETPVSLCHVMSSPELEWNAIAAFYQLVWTVSRFWKPLIVSAKLVFFLFAQQPGPPPHPVGHGLLIHEVSRSPQSVGLLWTSDQLVAETSTRQHTTITTDRHPCPRWDSNPQSQQASGSRPTP